jgi:methylaspartate ammonia-lyase
MTKEDLYALEKLIDKNGLHAFMEGVAQIAMEKAEHVQANYSDRITAKAWQKCSEYLSKVADSEHLKIF